MAFFLPNFSDELSFIKLVVDSFYDKAKSDIIIGYHFRHIDDFDVHLPKIHLFWAVQLLDLDSSQKKALLNKANLNSIIKKHEYLKIKKGEVGRWVLLFQSSIEENFSKIHNEEKREKLEVLKNQMTKKTELFHRVFLNSKSLFKN